MLFYFFTGISIYIRNFYISRAGNDSCSCDAKSKPCKTIWRAVSLASSGDYIHLDGNKTDKDPYTCQSKSAEYPGIYIRKSLSLIGFGRMVPRIRCLQGKSILFSGSEDEGSMKVSLSGLHFNESFVKFQDTSVTIDNCKFEGTHHKMEFLVRRNMPFIVQITNSVFRNSYNDCFSVVVNSASSLTQPLDLFQVILTLKNSSFQLDALSYKRRCISLISYELEQDVPLVNSNITLDSITFSKQKPSLSSFVYVDFKNGHQNLWLQNVTVIYKSPDTFSGQGIFTVRSHSIAISVNKSLFSSQGARALNVSAANILLEIYNSSFKGHMVKGEGGVILLKATHSCKVDVSNALFSNTTSTLRGGAISIECRNNGSGETPPTSIHIINTTFKNCSAAQGGAIFLRQFAGDAMIVIKNSLFVENCSPGGIGGHVGYGGAIGLSLESDGQDKGCPSWLHNSSLIVEDTRFERNAGEFGGAIYLINGNAIFRNCSFIDNFASVQGGHIYTEDGSTSLEIQHSLFKQNSKHIQFKVFSKAMNYTKISFIHAESARALKIYNTTLDAWPFHSKKFSLMDVTTVYQGRNIHFENDNSTVFYCPNGSRLEINNFITNMSLPWRNCTFKVTTLQYACVACSVHTYSMQRGSAFGGLLNQDFRCLLCPFGADCTGNISAKRNFWGFKEKNSPPTLKFAMCPPGYCRPPQNTNFLEYNSCQGNRSGKLCGQCNEAYTETLYSTNCRPSHECKDYWFWPVALVYVSFMALYFTYRPLFLPWIQRQIFWFKERQPDNKEDSFDSGYLKIIFYFYQAADLLLISRSSKSVIKKHLIKPLVGFFNFQQKISPSGLLCPFPGLTVVYKMLFSAFHVFGTFLMICSFYAFHYAVRMIRGQPSPSRDPYCGGILQTMLLGYSTLASISFNLLRCVPISAEKRLFYDGNIVCFQWWQYILVAFICTCFVPFVFVLLWGSFKLYSRTISVGRFLLACFFPLPSLLHWGYVSFLCGARKTLSEDPPPSQVSSNSVERVLYDCFKKPEDGGKLPLSWESVMIGRRLILIVLKAFISDPMPRLLIMSFFCVLFLLHHALTQPFRDRIANIAETMSLLCVVLLATVNVFFASFLSFAVTFTHGHFSYWRNICQKVEVIILCCVPGLFGIFLMMALFSQLCRVAVVLCRFVGNVCRAVCFRSRRYSSISDDKNKPLLASLD